jgi:hypothetical protein
MRPHRVREPLVVLDAKLRLKSASKAFFDKFAVSAEETLSKSLYDLGDRQWDIPGLRKLLAEVLPESKKSKIARSNTSSPSLDGDATQWPARRAERRQRTAAPSCDRGQ